MTIASEIERLQGVKADIFGAIAEKKVDVPSGAMLADAPELIRSIKSGINVKIGQGVYPAVKIGNQLWLARNLDEELGTLGVDEWYYNNDEATAKAKNYGRLYTLNNFRVNFVKLGLTKWRVPSTDDFLTLFNYVGGESTAAKKLKSNTKDWAQITYRGTDDFGFTALPTGYKNVNEISFFGIGSRARFWTNSPINYIFETTKESPTVNSSAASAEGAFSLRLVMDLNEDGTIPDSNIVIEDVPTTAAEPLAIASEAEG